MRAWWTFVLTATLAAAVAAQEGNPPAQEPEAKPVEEPKEPPAWKIPEKDIRKIEAPLAEFLTGDPRDRAELLKKIEKAIEKPVDGHSMLEDVAGLVAALEPVQADGEDDYEALRHHLPVGGDAEQDEGVVEKRHEQRADDHPEDGAATAAQRRAAEDHRGDDIELVAHAEVRVGACKVAGQDQAAQPGQKAAEGKDEQADRAQVDAGQPRGLRIVADRIDLPADDGAACERHAGGRARGR